MEKKLSINEKRAKALEILKRKKLQQQNVAQPQESLFDHVRQHYKEYTYDMFMSNNSAKLEEMVMFNEWVDVVNEHDLNGFEAVRTGAQTASDVNIIRQSGTTLQVLNFSNFNYLGYGQHPEVIEAGVAAIRKYGLGAGSTAALSGTYSVHKGLEKAIVNFFGLPEREAALFVSGYSANLGTIQAFVKPSGHIILDQMAHMSLLEGAKLSGAKISYFRHNDLDHLEQILQEVSNPLTRVLICMEGVYSGEGDRGNIKGVVQLAKKYQAYTLVDEAHSVLAAGSHGRGVCEEQGVLQDVDLYILTLSKAVAGVGGALLASKHIAKYVKWFAKCRMFATTMDPAVAGGLIKVFELASSKDGDERRSRLWESTNYLRSLLEGKVRLACGDSWIIPVIYGNEKMTIDVNDTLQRLGLDTSILQFPAVPKNEARFRVFVTSEHSREQLDKAAEIILQVAQKFGFLSNCEEV